MDYFFGFLFIISFFVMITYTIILKFSKAGVNLHKKREYLLQISIWMSVLFFALIGSGVPNKEGEPNRQIIYFFSLLLVASICTVAIYVMKYIFSSKSYSTKRKLKINISVCTILIVVSLIVLIYFALIKVSQETLIINNIILG